MHIDHHTAARQSQYPPTTIDGKSSPESRRRHLAPSAAHTRTQHHNGNLKSYMFLESLQLWALFSSEP